MCSELISPIVVRYTTTFFILSLPPSPFASIGANFSSPLTNFRRFQQFAGMMGDEGLVPSPEEELERRNAIDKLKQLPCRPYEFCHSNVVRSTF
ncbi:hypothetical protein K7X08_006174 [Anisodus acutangulus]|uniref:Uncharacterized protein n=1 Tax=Anisodus acutangulus TaxID=402998 RepID=A0A9Q1MYM2_9SOLA|nr:hypothetical protein K7X08_006174 [Anisodus acutangulus]